jgi:ABC-type sulfate transport system permease component
MWATGQSSGAPDRSCSLSGAPSGACSDSARAVSTVRCSLLQSTVGAVAVTPLGTPDSLVLHRTVR